MSASGCLESSHHSTYATFRSSKQPDCVPKQMSTSCIDYSTSSSANSNRGSSVVSAIMRTSSFISAEEEAHRILRCSTASSGPAQQIISSPSEHQQRIAPIMTASVPVPATFNEQLLSLEHDSLLMTSSSIADYSGSNNNSTSPSASGPLVHSPSMLPPQTQSFQSEGHQSQRSLLSNTSAGYHSNDSSVAVNRSGLRSVTSDDVSPPPSSASSSSSSSSSGPIAPSSQNANDSATSNQQEFFVTKSSPPPAPVVLPANSTMLSSSIYVPRCPSTHTALAAIDEEFPPLQSHEIAQVDIFYRSLKTDVRVANGMAQVYPETSSRVGDNFEDPSQSTCGVPLFLVDRFPTGNPKSRRNGQSVTPSRQVLYFILAERGTGFTLRRQRIVQQDCYTLASTSEADTHRLTVMGPKGYKTAYLIKFMSASCAGQFFTAYNELTRGDGIFTNKSKSSSSGFSAWWKGKLPSKLSLSRPCCFRHLTNLDSSYLALSQTAVIASPEHRRVSAPVNHVVDQRAQTMPRRLSAVPSSTSLSTTPTATPSITHSAQAAIRPSALSPLAAPQPCRVSMTPLAACPPAAPLG